MLNLHLLIALIWVVAGVMWLVGPAPSGLTISIGALCIVMASFKLSKAIRCGQRQQQEEGNSDE